MISPNPGAADSRKAAVERHTGPTPEQLRHKFPRQFEACDQFVAFTLDQFDPWSGAEHGLARLADRIVAAEICRGLKTFRSVVYSCGGGYGEQAAMQNRSLFEGMAVAHWVSKNPDVAEERFKKQFKHNQLLIRDAIEKLEWFEIDDPPTASPDERAELDRMFGRHGHKLWTPHKNLHRLVRDIEHLWLAGQLRTELWEMLEVPHVENNKQLHSTSWSIESTISADYEDGVSFWIGPSTEHIAEALFCGFWNWSQLFTLAMQHFGGGFDETEYERVYLDGRRLFARPPEGIEFPGRNDPCWCGSGKKYKKCHLD